MPTTDPTDAVPQSGDLTLFDCYKPALEAGDYTITVSHELDLGSGHPGAAVPGQGADPAAGLSPARFTATQTVVVSAPQVALDPSEVVAVYPPSGSSGRYAHVLPHVVLREAALPWEREIAFGGVRQPWLALLVLSPDEIVGGGGSPTGTTSTTVRGYSALFDGSGSIWIPDLRDPSARGPASARTAVERERDVGADDPCAYVTIAATTFGNIAPRFAETGYLAHCRRSDVDDKASGGDLVAVVVANRFPEEPKAGQPPVKTIVHLVSLQGFDDKLVEKPDFGGKDRVALLSLKSWTFLCQADRSQDFHALGESLVSAPDLLLRLPGGRHPTGAGPAADAARARMDAGYIPMPYRTRVGVETMAWYRGPLAPVLPTRSPFTVPLLSADAALIYDAEFGVFDASLAVAWGAGRAAALADKGFGQSLLALRRRAHRLTDALLLRHERGSEVGSSVAALDETRLIQEELASVLDKNLLGQIAKAQVRSPDATVRSAGVRSDPRATIRAFLDQPDVQSRIQAGVTEELVPIARWLARLSLLEGLPFDLLVPDASLLPPESLRFFYLDQGWIDAALEGALSTSLESSRDVLIHTLMADNLKRMAAAGAAALRAMTGAVDPSAEDAPSPFTGFLLCSAIVSGWPNLAVRPITDHGAPLKTLRLEHLSRNILIGLFAGAPSELVLSEPQQGLRFGVDEEGTIPLRQPVAGGRVPLGEPLADPPKNLTVQPDHLRVGGHRVLSLRPDRSEGLVSAIIDGLEWGSRSFSAADFALQMVKAPDSMHLSAETLS